jgi:hypothetical protein
MKAYGGVGVHIHVSLVSTLGECERSASSTGCFTQWEKALWYQFYRWLGGTQSRSEQTERQISRQQDNLINFFFIPFYLFLKSQVGLCNHHIFCVSVSPIYILNALTSLSKNLCMYMYHGLGIHLNTWLMNPSVQSMSVYVSLIIARQRLGNTRLARQRIYTRRNVAC